MSAGAIIKYCGGNDYWPPDTEYWMHTAWWWAEYDFNGEKPGTEPSEALRTWVDRTQREQAEYLAWAAKCCKDRFPECGGFILWMGHDCFPCPANTSIIDYDMNPKPAYYALQAVFRGDEFTREDGRVARRDGIRMVTVDSL
jgi:beta-mannosidase